MSLSALRLACVSFLALTWTIPASASCSRKISAAYSSPIAEVVYRSLPEQSLPSLVDGIAKASGCELEVQDLPTSRAWRDFDAGHLDIILVSIQTDDRDRLGDFVPGGSSSWVLVTSRSAADAPKKLEAFAGNRNLRLGVARGAAYPSELERFMDQLKSSNQIDESADFGMALTKLANGRDAGVLMIADAYAALMAAGNDSRFEAFEQQGLTPSKIGTYLNRQTLDSEDRKALISGLRKVLDNGLAAQLVRARVPQLAQPQPKVH